MEYSPKAYMVIIAIMIAFTLLSPYKSVLLFGLVLFGVFVLIKWLFWRNQFDYEER